MPLHECDGEHCRGCGECYDKTGQFVCSETCEHSERCTTCKMLPEDCICCVNGFADCTTEDPCGRCADAAAEAAEDAYWERRIDEARGK